MVILRELLTIDLRGTRFLRVVFKIRPKYDSGVGNTLVKYVVELNAVNATEAITLLTKIRKNWFYVKSATTQDLTSVQRFIRQQETELERLRSIIVIQAQTVQTMRKGDSDEMPRGETNW